MLLIFNCNLLVLNFLVPLLTSTLTKQEEDQDDETWNLAMAGII